MAHSLARIYLHVVFSTKERRPFLADGSVRARCFEYRAATCNALGCPADAVGGVADHVHILCRLGRTTAVADLVREMKRESSEWVKTVSDQVLGFEWQQGYGAFSLSPGHVAAATAYIRDQEEHHKAVSFQDEYRKLCRKYGIDLDERYAWE